MKNIFFSTSKYLFYFSFIFLLILYLFPGSLIGYFLYGNLGKQPDFISNPIGTSINHILFFFYLSILNFEPENNKIKTTKKIIGNNLISRRETRKFVSGAKIQ